MPFSEHHPPTSISMSLAVSVTLIYPPQLHTNLLPTRPALILGYSEHHKSYRCLDLSTNRLVISRHVVFDEAVFPFAASPPLADDLHFLISETTPMISHIGARLPAGSPAPHVATLAPPTRCSRGGSPHQAPHHGVQGPRTGDSRATHGFSIDPWCSRQARAPAPSSSQRLPRSTGDLH
jgi:hypothetical protein